MRAKHTTLTALALTLSVVLTACPRPADDDGTDSGANETTGETKEKPPQT